MPPKRSILYNFLHCGHAPAVFRLVHDAGVERHTVVGGGGGAAGVVDADLFHAGHHVAAGPQRGGQRDPVAQLQGVYLAEVTVRPPVVGREPCISIPDAGVGEVARALLQRGAVRPLVDLDGQADGGDLQGSQAAVRVVEIIRDLGIAAVGITSEKKARNNAVSMVK